MRGFLLFLFGLGGEISGTEQRKTEKENGTDYG